jgi:hypothetical protein
MNQNGMFDASGRCMSVIGLIRHGGILFVRA